ncbi:helix-turn-helix domain-containing protein [Streptosporangium sp. NPDC049078]|uniref:helix-turn-helix transcriptional regulator n=1 Tax=Streptosporangium sp. NPDC049078 TaxID=3155767 RepID=UPI003421A28F
MAKKTPKYLTLPETCRRLNRHRSTVTRLISSGKLKAIKSKASPQGRVLVVIESVEAYQKLQADEQVAG